MPKFKNPGLAAFTRLVSAVRAVNVAAGGGGNVDDAFMDLMQDAADAAENFRSKEPNIANFQLRTVDSKSYSGGTVQVRGKLKVDFDYWDESGQQLHYTSV